MIPINSPGIVLALRVEFLVGYGTRFLFLKIITPKSFVSNRKLPVVCDVIGIRR